MRRPNVLILSDAPEFSRALLTDWEGEPACPSFTLLSSELLERAGLELYQLVLMGKIQKQKAASALRAIRPSVAVIYVGEETKQFRAIRKLHPRLLVVAEKEGWIQDLMILSNEVLRRVEALARAREAEQRTAALRRQAMLGHYMLEVCPSINDALTSVLGNADLLLLEPGQLSAGGREQVRTIHTLALRLSEISSVSHRSRPR